MEILIRRDYSPAQEANAQLKSVEYRRNSYTSGSAHVDDMISLGKALVLCPDHTRRFSPKKARYRAHPDRAVKRVNGPCDYCKAVGLSFLFLNEVDAAEEQRKIEKYRRALEYGHLFNG